MGSTCCSPEQKYQPVVNTEVKNQDWADAVKHGNLTGVKILHHGDPDLVNEPVDNTGYQAIHYAVKNKNEQLLEYLLNNGANVNAQGGPDANSALHEAVLIADFVAVRKLFGFGIKDDLRNGQNKVALDYCNKKYKREFTKAKQFKKKHKDEFLKAKMRKREPSSLMLAGMNLNDTTEKTIREYVKRTDHEQNFFRKKKEEIEDREMAITEFGEHCGIECDEIAMTIKGMDMKKIWQKLAKRHATSITKQTEIYKILYGLTTLALKKKNPRAKKPPADSIKKLTGLLVKKLPKKKGKATLERDEFVKSFHTYLFKLHDELVEKESVVN